MAPVYPHVYFGACLGHSNDVTGVEWAAGEDDNQIFASSSLVSNSCCSHINSSPH